MNKHRRGANIPTAPSDSNPESTHNPRAAARRRLLRAIGKSGGLAVGAVVAAHWRKPAVRSVLLPAHAQTSPTVSCPVSVTANLDPQGTVSVAYSASLLVGTTVLTSAAVASGASTLLAGSSTFPPGHYSAGVTVQQATKQTVHFSATLACCNQTFTDRGENLGGSPDFAYLQPVVVDDDGACHIGF